MPYRSTKTYTHETGLSCAFRQWRAESHCAYLHGYALAVKFEFGAMELDENGWVMDFGGLKWVKEFLQKYFDHKTIVALDDPELQSFKQLDMLGIADICYMKNVGCEAFAYFIFSEVEKWLLYKHGVRVILNSVEVREHGGNSAIYSRL